MNKTIIAVLIAGFAGSAVAGGGHGFAVGGTGAAAGSVSSTAAFIEGRGSVEAINRGSSSVDSSYGRRDAEVEVRSKSVSEVNSTARGGAGYAEGASGAIGASGKVEGGYYGLKGTGAVGGSVSETWAGVDGKGHAYAKNEGKAQADADMNKKGTQSDADARSWNKSYVNSTRNGAAGAEGTTGAAAGVGRINGWFGGNE